MLGKASAPIANNGPLPNPLAHLQLREMDGSAAIGGEEEELGLVAIEERLVPAPLLLLQDVDLALELLERVDGPRGGQHL